jgi:hypothetical protein
METNLSVADLMMIATGLKEALGGMNYEGDGAFCYLCHEFTEDCECADPEIRDC